MENARYPLRNLQQYLETMKYQESIYQSDPLQLINSLEFVLTKTQEYIQNQSTKSIFLQLLKKRLDECYSIPHSFDLASNNLREKFDCVEIPQLIESSQKNPECQMVTDSRKIPKPVVKLTKCEISIKIPLHKFPKNTRVYGSRAEQEEEELFGAQAKFLNSKPKSQLIRMKVKRTHSLKEKSKQFKLKMFHEILREFLSKAGQQLSRVAEIYGVEAHPDGQKYVGYLNTLNQNYWNFREQRVIDLESPNRRYSQLSHQQQDQDLQICFLKIEAQLRQRVDFQVDNSVCKIKAKFYQVVSQADIKLEMHEILWNKWKNKFIKY